MGGWKIESTTFQRSDDVRFLVIGIPRVPFHSLNKSK